MRFATVRLGKDSVTEIRALVSTKAGRQEQPHMISTQCKQFPTDVDEGDFAVIWLGSDNTKGMKTEWDQGFRAIGKFHSIAKVDSRDEETHFTLSVSYVFKKSLGRVDFLRQASDGYYWCSAVPIIGVDDRANQTVRVITPEKRSNVSALLYCFARCLDGFEVEIASTYPELEPLLNYVPPNPRASTDEFGTPKALHDTPSLPPGVAHQRIFFGAPGTGKSYALKQQATEYFSSLSDNGEVRQRRVTFHPEYSFYQFVGTFRPATTDASEITYRFVPGPFASMLAKALNEPEFNFLLIIEEINRANPAAVFGEIFQLLDRDDAGVSEYPTAIQEEFQQYLDAKLEPSAKERLGRLVAQANSSVSATSHSVNETSHIVLPSNFLIWATMNSADQGVFPLDTAFKRRWDFEYTGINDNQELCPWNDYRVAINDLLRIEAQVSEDKLIGPFFLNLESDAISGNEGLLPEFKHAFKKVLMYVFEDAAAHYVNRIFDVSLVGQNPTLGHILDSWELYDFAIFTDLESFDETTT